MFSRNKQPSISKQGSSPQTPIAETLPTIATFNVSGRNFEIPISLLAAYPESKLYQLALSALSNLSRSGSNGNVTAAGASSQRTTTSAIFLPHNPAAFEIVLDYIRYGGRILCPPSVCREVIELQLRDFGLLNGYSKDTNISMMDDSKGSTDKKGEKGRDGELPSYNEATGSTKQETEKKLLDALVDISILPMLLGHARQNHSRVYIYITQSEVLVRDDRQNKPTNAMVVASELEEDGITEWLVLDTIHPNDDNGLSTGGTGDTAIINAVVAALRDVPDEHRQRVMQAIKQNTPATSSSSGSAEKTVLKPKIELPTLQFLQTASVLESLQSLLYARLTCSLVQATERELTVRFKDEFGLTGSRCVKSVRLAVVLAS